MSGEANVNKNQTVINIHTINKNKIKVIFKVINLQKKHTVVVVVVVGTTAEKREREETEAFIDFVQRVSMAARSSF